MKETPVSRTIAALIALLMLMSAAGALTGCGVENETMKSGTESRVETVTETETEEVIPENGSMLKVSTLHSELVVTEKTFEIPEELKKSQKIRFDNIFGDNMMLQAKMPVRLYGSCTDTAGDNICARLTDTKSGESECFYGKIVEKKFEIYISAHDYGGKYKIELISESGFTCSIKNVCFGEVFIFGGQSNMGWTMSQCYDGDIKTLLYADYIKNSANADIRLDLIYPNEAKKPQDHTGNATGWSTASANSVAPFSACGYFFARRFNELLGIPVGGIQSCMGGTHLSAWHPDSGTWYFGMIKPLEKMTVRGVIWYQGENDPNDYAKRLALTIELWRERFENPEMLFHVIQLPRFGSEEIYFNCREEDKKVCSLTELCTYSVNIDTGLYVQNVVKKDSLNIGSGIHPYQKKEVGERAADVVANTYFGLQGLYSSPYAVEVKLEEGGSVLVRFENVGEGLTLQGARGFELAARNGKFVGVEDPELVGKDSVRLRSEKVGSPAKVRYGFSNNTGKASDFARMKDCAESVCVYNTKDGAKAYPAEQFLMTING